jgi:MFS family permease
MIAASFDSWTPQTMSNIEKIYDLYGDRLIIATMHEIYDVENSKEEEQRAYARAYANEYCRSDKPSSLSMYAMLRGGANILTNAFRILRFVMDAGIGILTTAAADLIVHFFDGSTRQTMMGWNQAAASVGGVIFQLIGGYLAGINWRHACIATTLCAVFYLIAFIILPEPSPKAKTSEADKGVKVKFRMLGRTWALSIWYLFYAMFTFAFVTTTLMMAAGEHIATSADLGLTMSLLTISVSIVALFFGLAAKIFKRYVIAAGMLVNAIAALVAFTGRSLILIDIAMVLCGVGLALVVPGVLTRVTTIVVPAAATMALSIFYATSGLGQFVQPLVFARIQKELGITDFRQAFVISLAGLIVLFAYMVIYTIMNKEPKTQRAEAK